MQKEANTVLQIVDGNPAIAARKALRQAWSGGRHLELRLWFFVFLFLVMPAWAAKKPANADCLACHSDPTMSRGGQAPGFGAGGTVSRPKATIRRAGEWQRPCEQAGHAGPPLQSTSLEKNPWQTKSTGWARKISSPDAW